MEPAEAVEAPRQLIQLGSLQSPNLLRGVKPQPLKGSLDRNAPPYGPADRVQQGLADGLMRSYELTGGQSLKEWVRRLTA